MYELVRILVLYLPRGRFAPVAKGPRRNLATVFSHVGGNVARVKAKHKARRFKAL